VKSKTKRAKAKSAVEVFTEWIKSAPTAANVLESHEDITIPINITLHHSEWTWLTHAAFKMRKLLPESQEDRTFEGLASSALSHGIDTMLDDAEKKASEKGGDDAA
jgi:hypothetical protein